MEKSCLKRNTRLSKESKDAKAIGRFIKKHRRLKGWTQEKLACEASLVEGGEGVYRQLVSLIERGKRLATITQLKAIAGALETDYRAWF